MDAAEVMKCFEKVGRGAGCMALCPQGIQGEKRVFLVFFRLKSGGSDASGIVYGITAQMEA